MIARTRQQLAQHLWEDASYLDEARDYIPQIRLPPRLTAFEILELATADKDHIHTGVLRPDGSRIPPRYNHWVDDNMYADIGPYMFRTVAASVLALYVILGFPRSELPDPVSQEKLVTTYSHQRRNVGHLVDSCTLNGRHSPPQGCAHG